jgi:hypothetical protein
LKRARIEFCLASRPRASLRVEKIFADDNVGTYRRRRDIGFGSLVFNSRWRRRFSLLRQGPRTIFPNLVDAPADQTYCDQK